MIDRCSPQQLGSSVGKSIKLFHLLIKWQGDGNIPRSAPCCPSLCPLRTESSGKVQVFSSRNKESLSVNVKIHTVIVTVLSAQIQHGNNPSVFCWQCSAGCTVASCQVLLLNMLGGRGKHGVYDNVTWIIKMDENSIMGIYWMKPCG